MNIKEPITFYDNIMPLRHQNFTENLLLSNIKGLSFPYYYTGNLTGVNDPSNPTPERGFGTLLYAPNSNVKNDFLFQLLTPFYSLINQLDLFLYQISNSRVFLQLPSSNTSKILVPHTDQKDPHLVFLYYVNDSDGDTVFYAQDRKTEIKRVSPKKGRAVIFNGEIPHSGSTPTKNERLTININFTTLDENSIQIKKYPPI
tara:strand:+ start:887 stop:1489 length:603 start_codon:yes stop_codon:yes gene_type:complete